MALGFRMGAGGEKPRTETYNVTENGTFDMGENNLYRYVNANVETNKFVIVDIQSGDHTYNFADYGITIPVGYAPVIIPMENYPSSSRFRLLATPTRTSFRANGAGSNCRALISMIKATSWGYASKNESAAVFIQSFNIPYNKFALIPFTWTNVQSYEVTIDSSDSSKTRVALTYVSSATYNGYMYYQLD